MKHTLALLLLMPLAALHAAEIAVSSLDISLAANHSGWKARANLSTCGKPITLGDTIFSNGLGCHTKFRLVIDCHGTAKRFTSPAPATPAGWRRWAPHLITC